MIKKVRIGLLGGIGNNLFQIACAYAYSLKYNKELALKNEKFGTTHNALDTYKDNLLSNIIFDNKEYFSELYHEMVFYYKDIPKMDNHVLLVGYFQSEKYFKEYEKEIRALFSYPEEYQNKIKEKYKNFLNKNTCSIHIRRGDYLQSPDHHPTVSINYIMKSVRQMPEDSVFIVMSDDIEWCKKNLPNIPEKFIFIENTPDYEDLYLMSQCKNNIISNSSFSWWGAWLNNNENKKVIAPSKWFGKAINHNTIDLIPETWINV